MPDSKLKARARLHERVDQDTNLKREAELRMREARLTNRTDRFGREVHFADIYITCFITAYSGLFTGYVVCLLFYLAHLFCCYLEFDLEVLHASFGDTRIDIANVTLNDLVFDNAGCMVETLIYSFAIALISYELIDKLLVYKPTANLYGSLTKHFKLTYIPRYLEMTKYQLFIISVDLILYGERTQVCYRCLKLSYEKVCISQMIGRSALLYLALMLPSHCDIAVIDMIYDISFHFIPLEIKVYMINRKMPISCWPCCTLYYFAFEKQLNMITATHLYLVFQNYSNIHGAHHQYLEIVDFTVNFHMFYVRYHNLVVLVVARLPRGEPCMPRTSRDDTLMRGLPMATSDDDVKILPLNLQDLSYPLTSLEVRIHPDFPAQAVRNRKYAMRNLLGCVITGRGSSKSSEQNGITVVYAYNDSEVDNRYLQTADYYLNEMKVLSVVKRQAECKKLVTCDINHHSGCIISVPCRYPNMSYSNCDFALQRLKMIILRFLCIYKTHIFSTLLDNDTRMLSSPDLTKENILLYLSHFFHLPVNYRNRPGKVRTESRYRHDDYELIMCVNCICLLRIVLMNDYVQDVILAVGLYCMHLSESDMMNKIFSVCLYWKIHDNAWKADIRVLFLQVGITHLELFAHRKQSAAEVPDTSAVRHFRSGVNPANVRCREGGYSVELLCSWIKSPRLLKMEQSDWPEVATTLPFPSAPLEDWSVLMAIQTKIACISLLGHDRKSSPARVPGTQHGRNCVNTEPRFQAPRLQPEVTSARNASPLKMLCMYRCMIAALIEWPPVRVPNAADGGKCVNANSWYQALHSWPEVANVHRDPSLRLTCYSGEYCCFLTVSDTSKRPHIMLYSFCFVCDKNEIIFTVVRLERTPEVLLHHEASVTMLMVKSQFLILREDLKTDNIPDIHLETGRVHVLTPDHHRKWSTEEVCSALDDIECLLTRIRQRTARRHVRTCVSSADVMCRESWNTANLPCLWIDSPAFLKLDTCDWPEVATTLPLPSAPLEDESMLTAVQADISCVLPPGYHRKWSHTQESGVQEGRRYMDSRSRNQALRLQPEVISAHNVTLLKVICYCGEHRRILAETSPLNQQYPVHIPGPADGRVCINAGSRYQAIQSWPEVDNMLGVPTLKSACYGGEHRCLIAAATPSNQLLDALCFTCKKILRLIDGGLEPEPEVLHPEANARVLRVRASSQTVYGFLLRVKDGRSYMDSRSRKQALCLQPEVISANSVTLLKVICYCGEHRRILAETVPLNQQCPIHTSGAADGKECINAGFRCQALHSWPEVANMHRIPTLRSSCYGGEHRCLIAVAAPSNQHITLSDAFCFTCEKISMEHTNVRLEPEPEVLHPEANARVLKATTPSKTVCVFLKEEGDGMKGTGCDIMNEIESIEIMNMKKCSSPIDSKKKCVSEYMTAPWLSRLHLVHADPVGTLIRYHGEFERLCTSFTWWRRWYKKTRGEVVKGPLTSLELEEAELLLIEHVHGIFSWDIEALREQRRISASSDLSPLNPDLVDRFLVMQGRLRNLASADMNVQPCILPKRHHLSALLCRLEHYSSHVGSEPKTQNSLNDETSYISSMEVVSLIINRLLIKVSADPEDGTITSNHLLILLRHKWLSEFPDVAVELALQVEEGMSPRVWPRIVVTSINTGRGGRVCNVDIKTHRRNYSRPVNKLLRLNLDSD